MPKRKRRNTVLEDLQKKIIQMREQFEQFKTSRGRELESIESWNEEEGPGVEYSGIADGKFIQRKRGK